MRFKPKKRPASDNFLETAKNFAKETFFAEGRCIAHCIVRIGGGLETYCTEFGPAWEKSQRQKDIWEQLLLRLARRADEMAFVSEIWMADKVNPTGRSLEEVAGRIECLMVIHTSPTLETMWTAQIVRRENNIVSDKTVVLDWKEAEVKEGRFSHLFQRARRHERN